MKHFTKIRGKTKALLAATTILALFAASANAKGKIFHTDKDYVRFLMEKHGKEPIVRLILSNRNGRITLVINNELREFSGRPNSEYVTPYTICTDMNKIGWDILEFKDKLTEYEIEVRQREEARLKNTKLASHQIPKDLAKFIDMWETSEEEIEIPSAQNETEKSYKDGPSIDSDIVPYCQEPLEVHRIAEFLDRQDMVQSVYKEIAKLVAFNDQCSAEALTRVLANPKPCSLIKKEACKGLSNMGSHVLPLVMTLLENKNWLVRDYAFGVLAMKGEGGIDSLLAIVDDKTRYSKKDRNLAVKILGNQGVAKAMHPIIKALAENRIENNEAEETVKKIGAPAVAPLVEAIKAHQKYHGVFRRQALKMLVKIQDAESRKITKETLCEMLKDRDPLVRDTATELLISHSKYIPSFRADDLITEAITRDLSSPDENIRTTALKRLIADEYPNKVSHLLACLGDQNRLIRSNSARALGKHNEPRVVSALIKALHDTSQQVQASAASSLSMSKESKVVDALIQTLKKSDSSRFVRDCAAQSLIKIKDSRAIKPLIDELCNPNSPDPRKFLKEGIATFGPEAIDPLDASIRRQDTSIRSNMAEVLIGIGHSRADRILMELFWKPDYPIVNSHYKYYIRRIKKDDGGQRYSSAVQILVRAFKYNPNHGIAEHYYFYSCIPELEDAVRTWLAVLKEKNPSMTIMVTGPPCSLRHPIKKK